MAFLPPQWNINHEIFLFEIEIGKCTFSQFRIIFGGSNFPTIVIRCCKTYSPKVSGWMRNQLRTWNFSLVMRDSIQLSTEFNLEMFLSFRKEKSVIRLVQDLVLFDYCLQENEIHWRKNGSVSWINFSILTTGGRPPEAKTKAPQ